jgi:hypothetical protein
MTDVLAVAGFRFFRDNQLGFTLNAVYSKGGRVVGYQRRHDSLLDTDPPTN